MKLLDAGVHAFQLVLNPQELLIVALGRMAEDNLESDGGAWAEIAADLLADGCSVAETDIALAAAGCENPAFVTGIEADMQSIWRALV